MIQQCIENIAWDSINHLELPLNSWSKETFEVYSFRKRVNKDEESAQDLYR
jgi:hypothetical protein